MTTIKIPRSINSGDLKSELLGVVISHIESFREREGRDPVVFDLGCGSGDYAVQMAAAGAKVIAIDAENFEAEVMNSAARARLVARLNFVQMDIRKGLSPIRKMPDIVYFHRTIESMRYDEARDVLILLKKKNPLVEIFISSLHLAMFADSYLAKDEPLTQRLGELPPVLAMKHQTSGRVCLYHPDEMHQLLTETGFLKTQVWSSNNEELNAVARTG